MSGEYIAYLRQGALYTDSNISTNPRLVGPGDTLFGKTVSSLSIGPDAFVGNNIAFAATFSDGSQGVFIVGVPEPSMIAGLLPLALLLRRRRTLNAWMITP